MSSCLWLWWRECVNVAGLFSGSLASIHMLCKIESPCWFACTHGLSPGTAGLPAVPVLGIEDDLNETHPPLTATAEDSAT